MDITIDKTPTDIIIHKTATEDTALPCPYPLRSALLTLKSTIYYLFDAFYESEEKTIQQINFGFPPGNARRVPRLLNSTLLGT